MNTPVYVGLDLGTSGCRAIAVDPAGTPVAEARAVYPAPIPIRDDAIEQDPAHWLTAATAALQDLASVLNRRPVAALAVDGTSGTVLAADADGTPLGPALMYNDRRARDQAERITGAAPANSAAHGIASGLAKALWLGEHTPALPADWRLMHQADWLAHRLGADPGISDTNNALKTGYDPILGDWPQWLEPLLPRRHLPRVLAPGTPIGTMDGGVQRQLGLVAATGWITLVAGTSDSTAAVLATGAGEPGDAVTSLGSTLVLKVLSKEPVFAPEYGVYSQPLGELWLAGGGSNSGGSVLRQHFSDRELDRLSATMDPTRPTGLDYYPLPAPGERFPVNDPRLAPRLTPVPTDRQRFLQGLLEGMARIEKRGYELLRDLGAPWPRRLYSVGGGAGNPAWTAIRRRLLAVPMLPPRHREAAYGAALLARDGAQKVQR